LTCACRAGNECPEPVVILLTPEYRGARIDAGVGWTIVTVAVAATGALFAGSLILLASGQSVEQFQGME
jgi:hypothetical protein